MKLNRRTKKERSQIVKRWRSSGMTRVAFCKQEKIHVTTLAGWVKKEGGDLHVAIPKLVPLQIDKSYIAPVTRFEVEYPNGVRLHLATMPSMEELSSIVHLYSEPCFR